MPRFYSRFLDDMKELLNSFFDPLPAKTQIPYSSCVKIDNIAVDVAMYNTPVFFFLCNFPNEKGSRGCIKIC